MGKKANLSVTEQVMLSLRQNPFPTAGELAASERLNRTSVQSTLIRLLKQGAVERCMPWGMSSWVYWIPKTEPT